MQNHRGVYAEFTGDGSSTVLTIPLTSHYAGRSSQTGVPTVITGPSNFAHKAGKGGFYFPVDGTSVAVSSAVISGSNAVITTTAAVGNRTKAYVAFIFDQSSARG